MEKDRIRYCMEHLVLLVQAWAGPSGCATRKTDQVRNSNNLARHVRSKLI